MKELFSNDKNDFTDEDRKVLLSLRDDIAEELMKSCHYNVAVLKKNANHLINFPKVTKKGDFFSSLAKYICSIEDFQPNIETMPEKQKDALINMVFYWDFSYAELLNTLNARNGWSIKHEVLPLPSYIFYTYKSYFIASSVLKALKIQLKKYRPMLKEISEDEMKALPNYFSEEDGLVSFNIFKDAIQILENEGFFENAIGEKAPKKLKSKIAKLSSLKPFVRAKDLEEWNIPRKDAAAYEDARTDFLIGFITAGLTKPSYLFPEATDIPLDILELYRYCMKNFSDCIPTKFYEKYFLPGISIPPYTSNTDKNIFMHNFLDAMKKWDFTHPIYFSDLLDNFNEMDIDCPYGTDIVYRYTEYIKAYYYDDDKITTHKEYISTFADYRHRVYDPYFINMFLMFASIGLFSITWEPPIAYIKKSANISTEDDIKIKNMLSCYKYGKIGYIKMTALGAYVFGLTNKFVQIQENNIAPLYLDEIAPVIHIDKNDKVSKILLEQNCIPISPVLFKIDKFKILKNYNTVQQAETFFRQLETYSKKELPAIWKNIKDSICSSYISLTPDTDWIVLSLEGQKAELIGCVESIKQGGFEILKMEGKRICIKKDNLSKFIKLLEKKGIKINFTDGA